MSGTHRPATARWCNGSDQNQSWAACQECREPWPCVSAGFLSAIDESRATSPREPQSLLPDPRDKPWLTVKELAEITGEGEKAIRAALDAGQLPLLQVGRYKRIPTARLRAVLGID